jgi:hypothetical protein
MVVLGEVGQKLSLTNPSGPKYPVMEPLCILERVGRTRGNPPTPLASVPGSAHGVRWSLSVWISGLVPEPESQVPETRKPDAQRFVREAHAGRFGESGVGWGRTRAHLGFRTWWRGGTWRES